MTIAWIAMATVLLCMYFEFSKTGVVPTRISIIPIVSIAFYSIAIYSVFQFFRNVPIVTIDQEKISFNRKSYNWTELDKIILTGKQPFKYPMSPSYEASALTFLNGDIKVIFDSMYENIGEIKTFLRNRLNANTGTLVYAVSPINPTEFIAEDFETFKGNALFSMRGLFMWSLIGFMVYCLVTGNYRQPKKEFTIATICFGAFWFTFSSWQMDYFQLSEHFLLIRNHYFFWKQKAYRLTDIHEVIFETQGKLPNCLRVIKRDFKSRKYLAGTLTDDTWLALKERLESYGVTVRNECIPE
jgi:hypothetical protein